MTAAVSLSTRLLVAAGVVLTAFLGLTGAALDQAFRQSAETAARDRLQAELYLLLGATDPDPELGLTLPELLPDVRLASPGSGLYAEVVDREGRLVWRSGSTLGVAVAYPPPPPPGQQELQTVETEEGLALLTLSLGVLWEIVPGRDEGFTFRVAETRATLEAEIHRFRQSLWGWLAAAGLALLAVQGAVLRWGLAPLRAVVREVEAVEAGRQTALNGPYPRELRPLTDRLNGLLAHGRAQLERHRHALADLAHSLKTPLALLRGAAVPDTSPQDLRAGVLEQVDRMAAVVERELQRAATSGRAPLTAGVLVAPVVARIVATVARVHADRSLRVEVETPEGLRFAGDEGDLMELLGNLLDNAAKWARSWVRVGTSAIGAAGIRLTVEDDGPGIPGDALPRVLERGVRGDLAQPGHGIGLAVVRDLVEAYGGTLRLENRAEGGLWVEARFPG